MAYSYFQPEYYQKFRCMGGSCPVSCCHHWSISWKQAEIDKLKAADLSDEIRKLVDDRFVKPEKNTGSGSFEVKLDEDGSCPFQNKENGLCRIQTDVGEEYLGNTCGGYPRRFFASGNFVFRSCSTSCPAVIKLLMHDKRAAQMEIIPVRDLDTTITADSPQALKAIPYLRYRKQITDFYSWIFSGKTSYEMAMLMGPIPAKRVSDACSEGYDVLVPSLLSQAKDEFMSADLTALENSVMPDYKSKSIISDTLLMKLSGLSFDKDTLKTDGEFDKEKYIIGKKKFYENITNADMVLKNIAMNIFLDLFVYLDLKSKTFFDFFVYFTSCMSAIGYIVAADGYSGKNIEENFINDVSVFSRRISHSRESEKYIFDYLKENGINTPERVASFIK